VNSLINKKEENKQKQEKGEYPRERERDLERRNKIKKVKSKITPHTDIHCSF
jgi:hypothetical protein